MTMQPSQFNPGSTPGGFGGRAALKGLAAACAGGVSSYPLAAMAQAAGVESSPGAVQAWDKRFAGTGFHPGNTAERNREALAALWKYTDSLEDEGRFVAFLPGVHELQGSFSPSGTEPKANRRGGARMVLHFPGTTIRFRGNREDFNQMRLMHEGDSARSFSLNDSPSDCPPPS